MAKRKIKAVTVNQKQQKETKNNSFMENVKFFFKTLFSNDACVEAKKKPWYAALIIGVLSCVIATLPTMVSYFSKSGAAFFTAPNYSLDTSLVEFEKTLDANNVSMKMGEGKLVLNESDWNNICKDDKGNSQNFYGHYYTVTNVTIKEGESAKEETKTYCDLAVFYVSDAKLGTKTIAEYTKDEILLKEDPNAKLDNGVKTEDAYSTNVFVFGESAFIAFKKPVGADSYTAGIQGKYDFAKSFDLKDLYKQNMNGQAYKNEIGTAAHREEVMKAYEEFFQAAFESTKNTIAWQYTGIAFGINVALVFLFGLMIFIMTRGKQNPFRDITFLQSQKIIWWASMAPALLSLLGFMDFFANFAMFLFLFMLGLRTMWMSTRTLRPYQPQ